MALYAIETVGLEEGVALLERLRTAAGQFTGSLLRVGTPLGYAWGIETGFRQGGGVARRAGGAYYLRGASQQVLTETLGHRYAQALPQGPGAVRQVTTQTEQQLVVAAQGLVPVVSGRLQGSIRSYPAGR